MRSTKKIQPIRFSHLADYRQHMNVLFYYEDEVSMKKKPFQGYQIPAAVVYTVNIV